MHEKNEVISVEQLRIERCRYSILIDNDIKHMHFNENIHWKICGFIFITILLGAFYCWASASSSSNIYFLARRIFGKDYSLYVPLAIVVIIQIPLYAVVYSSSNLSKKLHVNELLYQITQHHIFCEYIYAKLNVDDLSYGDYIIMNNYPMISFDLFEFENYVSKYLKKKYKRVSFPFCFEERLANLILYNEVIENTVRLEDGITPKYFLTTFDNYSVWVS
jgi:hypothetical protein